MFLVQTLGLAELLDDFLPEEDMKNKKAEFIKSLTLSLTAKKTLKYETRNQSADSQTWFTERRNCLTTSNFSVKFVKCVRTLRVKIQCLKYYVIPIIQKL